jgi:hypothetical protein
MNVPLYNAIYEQYYQKSLPGDAGLENDMRGLGVLASQTERARQVFQRSALKAGLFWGGNSRLVLPPSNNIEREGREEVKEAPPPPPNPARTGGFTNTLLRELAERMLPPENEPFSARDRRRFFRALAVNLDVVYGEPDDGEIDADELANLFRLNSVRSVRQLDEGVQGSSSQTGQIGAP